MTQERAGTSCPVKNMNLVTVTVHRYRSDKSKPRARRAFYGRTSQMMYEGVHGATGAFCCKKGLRCVLSYLIRRVPRE